MFLRVQLTAQACRFIPPQVAAQAGAGRSRIRSDCAPGLSIHGRTPDERGAELGECVDPMQPTPIAQAPLRGALHATHEGLVRMSAAIRVTPTNRAGSAPRHSIPVTVQTVRKMPHA